jgi:hypothetical protein
MNVHPIRHDQIILFRVTGPGNIGNEERYIEQAKMSIP